MDALTAFGLFAVTMMFVCYALEDRDPWFVLAFAVACALGSAYGFLQGRLAVRPGRGDLVGRGRTAVARAAKTIGVKAGCLAPVRDNQLSPRPRHRCNNSVAQQN
jgi:hypothetical protein